MEKTFTFDALPQAIAALSNDVQELKRLVSKLAPSISQESDKLLTVAQAAILLNLAIPTIYGLVHRSLIPYMKKNKRLYFSETELRNWIKSGRHQTIEEIREDAAISLFQGK